MCNFQSSASAKAEIKKNRPRNVKNVSKRQKAYLIKMERFDWSEVISSRILDEKSRLQVRNKEQRKGIVPTYCFVLRWEIRM